MGYFEDLDARIKAREDKLTASVEKRDRWLKGETEIEACFSRALDGELKQADQTLDELGLLRSLLERAGEGLEWPRDTLRFSAPVEPEETETRTAERSPKSYFFSNGVPRRVPMIDGVIDWPVEDEDEDDTVEVLDESGNPVRVRRRKDRR